MTGVPMTQGQIVATAARVRQRVAELEKFGFKPVGVVVSTQRNGVTELLGLPVTFSSKLGWSDVRIEVEA